jgi:hypothetical protein
MSKKFSELEGNEKKSIENELEAKSTELGMDSWESQGNSSDSILKNQIGICYNCKYLQYCRTEFNNVFAKCSELDFKLSGQNRIVECNIHSAKNVLSLNEMYNMAYLIEAGEEKVKGFITTDKKYRK